jgi:DnaK suppressor protein
MKKSRTGKNVPALTRKLAARGSARVAPLAARRAKRPGVGKKAKRVVLPTGYRPTENEPFMSSRMREYFRQKLLKWRGELVRESEETLQSLQEGGIVEPDIADRASIETDRSLELRTRDRARKLIVKIDEALERVEKGTYGYCEETGEPIAISRLEARPIATLSIEAQERHERMERTHRDD